MDKFNYEENGYNREEVNQFVVDVIKQTESIVNKCKSQQEEIGRLKSELEHYHKMEDQMKKSLMQTEKAGERIKEMAREQAEMIITDAKRNASTIVNEALLEADKIEIRYATLEKNLKVLKRKLNLILEQQQEVVKEIDTLDFEE